ncbi:MAG: hypothetical protein A2931_02720 [Candidatus Niyogibacteria bacterium RIFCSPLOWO2_01_FULL_45_48]|uniref:Uncharacterized protein n=2 Tax=Candidatus Niyogiibacteriota TaxID=1817912 RepID=A0A1G2EY36_9BACT|nr:MAG: hypothetical protein A2931_02720 [Candidatus Niyogibacteria bacterium RIFCSPLOWO2_01_FULL_45_48]OGZ29367.1 MAG: hypothetical protein A2835_02060 [Candidatus Niyogibacteria bacterium RIFCSPHIGHO2_01_FULL_45_28]OGZ30719.1 MAG: hypothetical protein A3J00_02695 [Candidatus Niyogibacteria bacterium RIFCSPLOWO2_02_FULL_45_13]
MSDWANILIAFAVAFFVVYTVPFIYRIVKTLYFKRLTYQAFGDTELYLGKEKYNSPKRVLKRAKKSLESLREGSGDPKYVEQDIDSINAAFQIGWTHKDIGTTQEELKKLHNGGSLMIFAKNELDRAREEDAAGSNMADFGLYAIEKVLEKAGLLLADIGTSKEELNGIERRAEFRRTIQKIDDLRQMSLGKKASPFDPEYLYKEIVSALSPEKTSFGTIHVFSPEELGTSFEELACLVKEASNIFKPDRD